MPVNDKLKGAYYRVPMTKLASRSAIINQFNELIDYFNSLNDLLSNIFNEVTETREYAIGLLLKMEATIAHFKYLKEQYQKELDAHIADRLAILIETFTSSFNNILSTYETNMFNHATISDTEGSAYTKSEDNDLQEWDKSISMNASDLGIRWFGGKFSDKHVVSELNNIFHLVKINTADGKINEDIINSNTILELFVKTPKGISWLVLGQNGGLGYNMIVKYQSGELINNIKIMSENYYTPKQYDINHFDLNMFITTILNIDDTKGSNVFIKVKTNIPSNTESGREGYFISSSNTNNDTFDDYHESREIINTANKLMYDDNKDLEILKRDDRSISDILKIDNPIVVESEETVNPIVKKEYPNDNKDIKSEGSAYYAELKNRYESNKEVSFNNETKNASGDTMNNMLDTVNGRITHHENFVNLKGSFFEDSFDNTNKEYIDGAKPKYFKGQQIADLFDYRTVGKVNLLAKNENMYEIDGVINNKHSVVQNDVVYMANKDDTSVVNRLYNNGLFDSFDNENYIEKKFRVLCKNDEDFKINCIVKTEMLGILIGTTKGVYFVNENKGFVGPKVNVKCIIEFNKNIFVGTTGNGIKIWDNSSKTFEDTNLIASNISSMVVAKKPNSDSYTVYAFKSNCSYTAKTDLGKYDLVGFYYCLYDNTDPKHGWRKDQDLGGFTMLNDPTLFRVDDEVTAKGITDSNNELDDSATSGSEDQQYINKTQDYKIIYNEYTKKWYILNKDSGFVAYTPTERFINFRQSEITKTFGNNVEDIMYYNGCIYISVKNTSEDGDNSAVYKYDGNEYKQIKSVNIEIKNDRDIVERAIYLDNLSKLV